MNEKVRMYLIEAARQKDKFVYYSDVVKDCELNIDITTESGRKQLKDVLGEVSAFEHNQPIPRPLISSLAIYKDKNKNDHGDGFYKLAEQLGKGSFKKLKDDLYGFSEAERCRQYWNNDSNYENYAHLPQSKQKTISHLFTNLIEKEEYWVTEWKNDYLFFIKNIKILRENIEKNPTLPIDSNQLYSGLHESIRGYENFMRKWFKDKSNGISSRGRSILSANDFNKIINDDVFKLFSKAIILKPNLENYTTFTSWWYENDLINNRPLLINRAFAACNPEILSSTVDSQKFWKVIDIVQKSYSFEFKNEHNYSWFVANKQLTEWLDDELQEILQEKTNNDLEKLVWRNIFVWLIYNEFNTEIIIPNQLLKRDRPKNGFEEIPENNRTFEGIEVDFESKAKAQKDLGDVGEELVKQYETNYLKQKGMYKESEKVRIVKDGEGYDVYSFDDLGNEKYIEVKTTTGNDLTPFYLSENEVAFMKLNINAYSIYRVFNYDEENNSGEFFEINGNVEEQILMKPIQYKVFIKK